MLKFDDAFDVEPNISTAFNAANSYSMEYKDNTIKTTDQAGYTHTRPRSTRAQRVFTYAWNGVADEYFADLQKFYETVGTHTAFIFEDYASEEKYEVRFAEPLSAQYVSPSGWTFVIKFEEV